MDATGTLSAPQTLDERSAPPVRVLVVHAHAVLRRGLVAVVNDDPSLLTVGLAASVQAARGLHARVGADVAVVDELLWHEAGARWPHDPARSSAPVACLLVGTTIAPPDGHETLTAGASGYVNIATTPAGLARAARIVAAGGYYVDDCVNAPILLIDGPPDEGDDEGYRLTPAEQRVLDYLVRGLTNAAIAEELHVSENTVKTQLGSIYRKLDVSRRSHATAVALREGLVT